MNNVINVELQNGCGKWMKTLVAITREWKRDRKPLRRAMTWNDLSAPLANQTGEGGNEEKKRAATHTLIASGGWLVEVPLFPALVPLASSSLAERKIERLPLDALTLMLRAATTTNKNFELEPLNNTRTMLFIHFWVCVGTCAVKAEGMSSFHDLTVMTNRQRSVTPAFETFQKSEYLSCHYALLGKAIATCVYFVLQKGHRLHDNT